ncbi:hypothetical protein LCGC14_2740720 [marine sediment metagenome]|uniref:DUF1353 domain-containing protein n=1 Tax=marine sediment metagenome TaxID=412755 RepID=A0A0F8ZRN1_9ZZZZ
MTVTYSGGVLLESTPNAEEPFVLARGFTVTWMRDGQETVKFIVRKGFTTDLASIPRVARSIIPQVGRHIQPAIVHDWAYEDHTDLTRAEADMLFLEGMKAVGMPWLRRNVMYAAVRAFGRGLWG